MAISHLRTDGFKISCEAGPDPKYQLHSGPGSLADGSYVCPGCEHTIFIGDVSDRCHNPHCEVINP